ncbi:cortexin-2-like [Kryptolebias marmoratus]|uniref:cortexin-2-like n=1 Tax=Kryptolebias marmoratus TaxID=37003 RepID=UPI0018ACFF44|nr:cortexin-2-like [Kryptolebias marmoratus]
MSPNSLLTIKGGRRCQTGHLCSPLAVGRGQNVKRRRAEELPGSPVGSGTMGPPIVSAAGLDVDVDLGFALFFFFLLCFFLLGTIVRCAQLVLDPYSAVSVSTYQEEDTEE